jgi:hypothetical protein
MQKKISELELAETIGIEDTIILNQQIETKKATIITLKNSLGIPQIFSLKGITSGNQKDKRIYLDETNSKLPTLPNNSLWTFEIKVSAISISNNDDIENGELLKTTLGAWWIFRGGILVQSLEGADFSEQARILPGLMMEAGKDNGLSEASVSVSAYEGSPFDEPNALDIKVSGVEGKVINWAALVEICQVTDTNN